MDIQIALVDDHLLFRSGIASLIQKLKGYKIIFEAANGKEMIGKIQSGLIPDIIVVDINVPVRNGTDVTGWLRNDYSEIKVIVLSIFDTPAKVLSMLRLGIKGYLLKDAEPYEFEQALQRVSHDEVYYPDFVTKYLLDTINPSIDHSKLNSRELEFLRLASTELTYKEIAAQMEVSARTVDGYRDQLFEKLSVKSRVGLVLYAIKNKLINL